MSTRKEIQVLEERLREAELGPDAETFEELLADHGRNCAVVICTGHFKGEQFSGALKFMRVWLKAKGRWQIVAGSIHE